jgi:protease-4
VAAGRPRLTPGRIAELADGRIYTAQQALDTGLIDEIGYLDDSIARLKETAGLTEASVVTYTRPGEYKGSVYAAPVVDINLGLPGLDAPGFLYLWQP